MPKHPKYRNLFFDLDNTLWDFSENARTVLKQVFQMHHLERFFPDFPAFYAAYMRVNDRFWADYTVGKISKETLHKSRFECTLEEAGLSDPELAARFGAHYMELIPHQKALVPGAKEVLQELQGRYNLYILSNGFRPIQLCKMAAGGLEGYFKKCIFSEDYGLLKPAPELFSYALSCAQATAANSLMIGDDFRADISGAKAAGIDQAFLTPTPQAPLPFSPTFTISSLLQLTDML